jgi:hypothetical protein
MGDACEMLVAAELTLAGTPAIKLPDNWPGYDVIAEPKDGRVPQRISVKSRTYKPGPNAYVEYNINDKSFDWLAIVLLPEEDEINRRFFTNRRFFIVPKTIAEVKFQHRGPSSKYRDYLYLQVDKMAKVLSGFEDNFGLSETGTAKSK